MYIVYAIVMIYDGEEKIYSESWAMVLTNQIKENYLCDKNRMLNGLLFCKISITGIHMDVS